MTRLHHTKGSNHNQQTSMPSLCSHNSSTVTNCFDKRGQAANID